MSSLARAVAAPRFALSFTGGGARLSLRAPLGAGPATVEALEVAVDKVSFPVDLRSGPAALRRRRCRVETATLRVARRELEGRCAALGVRLRIDGADYDGLHVSFEDEAGVVATCLGVLDDGPDLLLVPRFARAVKDAPASPLRRVVVAAGRLGLTADEARGGLRLERPLFRLLAEALVPHGYRVPDERSCMPARLTVHRDELHFELDVDEVGPDTSALREEAARGADAFALAAAAERSTAQDLGAEGAPSHYALAARCRRALRRGDGDGAAAAARGLAAADPSPWLASEALVEAAGAVAGERPAVASALALRAASLDAHDAERYRAWIGVAGRAGAIDAVRALAGAAAASSLGATGRGLVHAEAALHLLVARAPHELARQQVDAARRLAPDEPRFHEAAAAVAEAGSDLPDAVAHLERGAEIELRRGRIGRAAHLHAEVAKVLLRLERPRAAERHLEQVRLTLGPTAPTLHALAELRDLRRDPSAERLWAELRELPAASPGLVEALLAAATNALRGHLEAARPFVARLRQVAETDARVERLAAEFDGRDAQALLANLEHLAQADPDRLERLATQAPAADLVRGCLAAAALANDPGPLVATALSAAEREAGADSLRQLVRGLDAITPSQGPPPVFDLARATLAARDEADS